MFEDMMGKLQQQMEESKKRLDSVIVEADAGGGAVKVKMTGNREVKSVWISDELHKGDKEELEDLLSVAFNRALALADKAHEEEMRGAAGGLLPGFPGI
jgi:nucleoid-associated protein EbfC